MDFVISVIHAVTNVADAAKFLCDNLGFQLKVQTEQAVVVDNGAIAVRLVPLAATANQPQLTLELQSQQLTKTTEDLLALPKLSLLERNCAIGTNRVENRLLGPYGIGITVAQVFNEDQLAVLPPLPMSLIWDEQAEQCLRKLLRLIPVDFRDTARIRITEQAEMLAAADAAITVNLTNALQALAEITPHFQHPMLVAALREMGIEPSAHFQQPPI